MILAVDEGSAWYARLEHTSCCWFSTIFFVKDKQHAHGNNSRMLAGSQLLRVQRNLCCIVITTFFNLCSVGRLNAIADVDSDMLRPWWMGYLLVEVDSLGPSSQADNQKSSLPISCTNNGVGIWSWHLQPCMCLHCSLSWPWWWMYLSRLLHSGSGKTYFHTANSETMASDQEFCCESTWKNNNGNESWDC